jgi:hypothetical protein
MTARAKQLPRKCDLCPEFRASTVASARYSGPVPVRRWDRVEPGGHGLDAYHHRLLGKSHYRNH